MSPVSNNSYSDPTSKSKKEKEHLFNQLSRSNMSSHHQSIERESGQTYHLEEAIDALGVGKFHWLLLLYVGFAWSADAMEMMLLSFLGPSVILN